MLLFIVNLVCIQPPLPGKEIEKGKRKEEKIGKSRLGAVKERNLHKNGILKSNCCFSAVKEGNLDNKVSQRVFNKNFAIGRKRDVFSLTAMRAGASMLLLYLLKGSISGIGKVVAMSSICGKSLVEMQRGVAYNRPIAKT